MYLGDIMRGGGKFKRMLEQMAERGDLGARVQVGIIEQATYKDGQSVAQVAAWNEFGTTHIPSRPFFRQTIAQNKSQWAKHAASVLKAHHYDVPLALGLMGEVVKGQLIDTIQNFNQPPNAASTVAKKGFNKPLIDTGTLWRSIDYQVVDE